MVETWIAKIVLPLLTTALWLASAAASTAQANPLAAPQSQLSPAKPSVPLPRLLYKSGSQVSLNGRTLPAAWSQWQSGGLTGKVRSGISDAGVRQLLGVELLNTKDAAKQPVQWFSKSTTAPLILNTWLRGGYRYLDITQLADDEGWKLSVDGSTLRITTPIARVKAIRQGRHLGIDRIVVDLDRSTPWQVSQETRVVRTASTDKLKSTQQWAIAIDAVEPRAPSPAPLSPLSPLSPEGTPSSPEGAPSPPCPSALIGVETALNRTTIRLRLPDGLSPRVSTLANPNRLVIDIRPDAMVERNILWASGLRWRQEFLNLGTSRFPVVWLEISPRVFELKLKPILSDTTLVGIAPLLKTAQSYSAVAAINGGFFNRNNKLPLGAIRRDGRWLSSPILNRGAIAWNDAGEVKIGRLSLQEMIITSTGQRLPILAFNSGYVQAGIARYSQAWGLSYTPLLDNEIIVVVQNNQVTAQLPGGAAGITAFAIPPDGYLLVLRGNSTAGNFLPVGSVVRRESAAVPAYFAPYPQILGAGPILVQNRQIVLDAKAEGFSDAFIQETAARSAVGTTVEGTLLIAAVHNRVGGDGPTLTEIARVMQHLGCVDALNLDGGSSTSLYLGGQLLNRSPRTAARVHNGLGVFLQPRP